MTALKSKKSLIKTEERTEAAIIFGEDTYLLRDIATSELQEKQGKVITHNELKKKAKKWLA